MQILEECRLIDALGEWGIHEGLGRGRNRYPATLFEGPDRILNGAEVALTYRAPLSWRILRGWPLVCLRVDFGQEDVPALHIADGRPLQAWTNAVMQDQADSGRHVRAMAAAADRVVGPLLCAAQRAGENPLRVRAPIVIFDAWHRAAAWVSQIGGGESYPIRGYLVVTEHRTPLLGEA